PHPADLRGTVRTGRTPVRHSLCSSELNANWRRSEGGARDSPDYAERVGWGAGTAAYGLIDHIGPIRPQHRHFPKDCTLIFRIYSLPGMRDSHGPRVAPRAPATDNDNR